MNRFSIVLLGVALGATSAFSYLGQVVGSFTGPAWVCGGLAISRNHIYVLESNWPHDVYRCNPTTGSVVSSFRLPDITDNYWGLAYGSEGYLWAADPPNRCVYRVDAVSGSRYGSWSTGGHGCTGLAPRCTGDGGLGTTRIFVTDFFVFVHHKVTGSLIRSFPVTYPSQNDCAYDWRNNALWLGQDITPFTVYAYRPSGYVLASFALAKPGYWGAGGLTYSGEYLWVACSYRGGGKDPVYRIHCPARIGVAPASVGKVKALFR